MQTIILSDALIRRYADHLREEERAPATVQKYTRDLTAFRTYMQGSPVTRTALIEWKTALTERYAPASVNSMLAAVNGLLTYLGRRDLTVKPLKIQKTLFLDDAKELTRQDYRCLVETAERCGDRRLSLIMQTICATGIRVSELRYITVEAVKRGRAEIRNKGKLRVVFLPATLCRLLKAYLRIQKKTAGAVFTTRTGHPLDRSNIWRDMKALCESAGVEASKVFPHNLRHLFARTYYAVQKDMTRLADILGHTSINTTRIYTAESGDIHARQVEQLALVIT